MRGGAGEDDMMDFVYVLATIGFFAVCVLYALAAERL